MVADIALLVGAAIILLLVRHGAKRFVARQRQLGRWDEEGPLEPTDGPPHMTRSYGMEERLEVVGKWRGQRRPRK